MSQSPFWIDDLSPTPTPQATPWNLVTLLGVLFGVLCVVMHLGILSLLVFLALRTPWLWSGVVLYAVMIGAIALAMRRGALIGRKTRQVQERARELTGASRIGSAIHTAGHPLLEVDQPIVLALKPSELSIYAFSSAVPIDSVQIKDISAVHTVVFDDERIPHVEVADNTAQALQLSFAWRGQQCTCVFRRMRKVRAIEWYQAIEAARLMA